MELNLDTLREAVAGTTAAFRCVTDYQPAGGPGDKVFPPTYAGGKYATEERVDPETGNRRNCVLLDSVQSQANRMELALLEAHRAGQITLPLLITRFDEDSLLKRFTVSSLEAPHRIADALFRDSLLDGVIFRESEVGRTLDNADTRNATELFGLCPTALVFGLWDSTGPRGGLGAKFQRALVSEIVGYDAVAGTNVVSRIDPAEIRLAAGTLYERASESDDAPRWTLDEGVAKRVKSKPKKLGKDGKPSEANLSNVTPDLAFSRDQSRQPIYDTRVDANGREHREPRVRGGFTVTKAVQTTVISLSAIRRMRFPLDGTTESDGNVDLAARTALAALGLAAGSLARCDVDLRSRCQLFPEGDSPWQLLDRPKQTPQEFELPADNACGLLQNAIEEARHVGLPWRDVIELTPSPDLVELVRRSQELAIESGADVD